MENKLGSGLWCLTPLSTIFQLCCDNVMENECSLQLNLGVFNVSAALYTWMNFTSAFINPGQLNFVHKSLPRLTG